MIKILAVDDEPGICNVLKRTFEPTGFIVLTATNGKDAISLVNKERPKIVFLDIKMLGMSGFEVLKEIKLIDNNIKVIMITVMDDAATKEEARRLGADDFVTKPFISSQLEEIVIREIKDLTKPKILIVDDEQNIVQTFADYLSRNVNCDVELSYSGKDALEKLKKGVFDLALLDIMMPGLSGIDVIEEIQKFSPQTKILAISGYDSLDVADKALKAGAADFLHKPVPPKALAHKIKQILGEIGKYSPI
jgi:DNA-binding response OmpR family regulator